MKKIFLLFLLLEACSAPKPQERRVFTSVRNTGSIRKVFFIHTNDIHDHICGSLEGPTVAQKGGIVRIANYVKRRIRELQKNDIEPIITDSGDIYERGAKISIDQKGDITDKAFHEIPYTLRTLGDHEIIYNSYKNAGDKPFLQTLKHSHEKKISVIVSNVYSQALFKKVPVKEDNFPFKEGDYKLIQDSLVIEREGVRIGFVGMSEPGHSNKNFGTFDKQQSLKLFKESVQKVLNQDVHLVVAVTHLGLPYPEDDSNRFRDTDLIKNVKGIDMILGGNSHHIATGKDWSGPQSPFDLLAKPDLYPVDKIFFFTPGNSKKPVYVQTGKNGSHIADFWISVDTSKTAKERLMTGAVGVLDYSGSINPLHEEGQDPTVLSLAEGCSKPEYDNIYETHRK